MTQKRSLENITLEVYKKNVNIISSFPELKRRVNEKIVLN